MRVRSILLALIFAAAAVATPIFSVVNLGTRNGNAATASAVNNAGEVAGYTVTSAGDQRAFDGSDSGLFDITPLGAWDAAAYGINDSGQVAGTQWTASGAQAVVWSNGAAAGPGTLGGANSYGLAINASDQVTGSAATWGGESHAYLSSGGQMADLGTLAGGTTSAGYAINDNGEVAGYGDVSPGVFRAFTWTSATGMVALGTLGGVDSYAMGVNGSGQVVGSSNVADGYSHAFLYDATGMHDLGTLGGGSSYAYGINDAGSVVGYSWVAGGSDTHAFLYYDGVLFDLNSLIPADSGWLLTAAYGINDQGQIVGTGWFEGEQCAFLLTDSPAPVDVGSDVLAPEPSTLWLFLLGVALIAVSRMIRRRVNP
jgi:probable HAF family extracellular repeat protein